MARNKAIFDADILINTVKTKSVEYLTSVFEQIYVSDYVWKCEIKEDSPEYPVLKRMSNRGLIKLLDFSNFRFIKTETLKSKEILTLGTIEDFMMFGRIIKWRGKMYMQ